MATTAAIKAALGAAGYTLIGPGDFGGERADTLSVAVGDISIVRSGVADWWIYTNWSLDLRLRDKKDDTDFAAAAESVFNALLNAYPQVALNPDSFTATIGPLEPGQELMRIMTMTFTTRRLAQV